MKRSLSLRLRVTLICTALLALCCILITLTNNFSAVRMADSIQAVTVLPAQSEGAEDTAETPMVELTASIAVHQARNTFHVQSLLAMVAILAAGALLIYYMMGRALAPLEELTRQIRSRTAEDLAHPLAVSHCGGEVAELTNAFNQMSCRLDQVFVMQKHFSHNAAHELRTPLAILKTRTGLFRKKYGPQSSEVEELLAILEEEVDRLSGIVGSLLDLTNLEQATALESVSTDVLLKRATQELSLQAADRGISIQTAGTSCLVRGNSELLYRAVRNLVENAVKYSPENSTVGVTVQPEGMWGQILVEDQGPGIPDELRQQIFEPFFRVDYGRSRQHGGTGLGLALVRSVAAFHGGMVWVEERSGGGSRFVLELPLNDGQSMD